MIIVKARSVWQGKVGIRDKYVNSAIKSGRGLEITYRTEIMAIPAGEVRKKIVGKSENPFLDRFGGGWHYLIYFIWKPIVNQKKLL